MKISAFSLPPDDTRRSLTLHPMEICWRLAENDVQQATATMEALEEVWVTPQVNLSRVRLFPARQTRSYGALDEPEQLYVALESTRTEHNGKA